MLMVRFNHFQPIEERPDPKKQILEDGCCVAAMAPATAAASQPHKRNCSGSGAVRAAGWMEWQAASQGYSRRAGALWRGAAWRDAEAGGWTRQAATRRAARRAGRRWMYGQRRASEGERL